MKPKIVVTRQMTDAVMERIGREFDAVLPPPGGLNPDQVIDALTTHRAEGLLFNGGTRFDLAYIDRLPAMLKVAATCSVGFDHIDVVAAKAKGLVVTNTPEVLDNSVADFAFLLILGAARRSIEYAAVMRNGWGRYFGVPEMLGIDVSGKTLGIVGMGRIGAALARRARGFDMNVVYHNRNRLPEGQEEGATYYSSLDEMLPHCQFLSLHAPATSSTNNLMDAHTIGLLPKGAILVNTARGTLVDEDALIDALKSGQLFGAGLDVFKNEPNPSPRLAELPNVFLAPHMASATEETRTAMGNLCLDNIAAVLAGKAAPTPL